MKNNGFTLPELLGVIIIITLLSIVIFPNIISNFFKATEELDAATEVVVIEAAKDYYAKYQNKISNLDYCITISNLQLEGLLSEDIKNSDGELLDTSTIVKIYKNGLNYKINESCELSTEDIELSAKRYYEDGNISLSEGESKCVSILTLQNNYYLSKNITNGKKVYDGNINVKLTLNGGLTSTYNESC